MKKFLMFLCAVMMVFAVIGNAHALSLISNGDFEDTVDLNGWTTSGDVKIANTSGPYFTTTEGMQNRYALIGENTTDGTSILSQLFVATGLDSLIISFNWVVNYWDNSDIGEDKFLSLVTLDGTPAVEITLQDLSTNGTFENPTANCAYGSYAQTINISSYSSNNGDLIFNLVEHSNSSFFVGTDAIAGIDNVAVSAAPVPEPATILLIGSGLLGLVGYNRKRFSKKS